MADALSDAQWARSCAARELVAAENDVAELTMRLELARNRVERATEQVVAAAAKIKKLEQE